MRRPWRVSLFAMVLAAAGLPIYIHLPRYASVDLGLDLATVGVILMGIRVYDFVSDPLLGRCVDGWRGPRAGIAAIALGVMAVGFVMLFSLPPQTEVRLWLVMALLLVFTGYSLGTILLYGDSAILAGSAARDAQLRLASWRESGLILGVLLAAMAPLVLPGGFAGLGWLLAGAVAVVWVATRRLWARPSHPQTRFDARGFLRAGGGWLLGLAVVNSLPVAITSTLFVFFVEDHLGLSGGAGPFLVIFFAGSGLALPVWSALARRIGPRAVLLAGIVLAVLSFVWAASIGPGNGWSFAAICLASGIAVGADLVILPAVFAALLGRAGIATGQSFGLWSFATKLSLPLAAVVVLPALDAVGFVAGQPNPAEATARLVMLYALLPCLLKILAGAAVLLMPRHVWADSSASAGPERQPG